MGDFIKAILGVQVPQLLILAGLAFLFVAVAGNISGKIDPGRYGRMAAGAIGGILLLAGLIFGGVAPAQVVAPALTPSAVAGNVFTPTSVPAPATPTPTLAPAPAQPTWTPAPAPASPAQLVGARDVGFVRAAFSPDGSEIVTAGLDGFARIWDLRSNTSRVDIAAQLNAGLPDGKKLHSAAFSPDGKWVLTGGEDNTVGVWDAASGAQLAVVPAADDEITDAEFDFSGKLIVTTSLNGTAALWNLDQTKKPWSIVKRWELAGPMGHTGPVTGAAFTRLGDKVATASFDKTVRVWLVKDGSLVETISAPASLNGVGFNVDGTRIVTAGCDGNALVWDVGPPFSQKFSLSHGTGLAVWTAMYSPLGDQILTAGNDYNARLWNAATGKQLLVLPHGEAVSSAAFSSDGSRAVTASADGVASIWDLSKLLKQQPSGPLSHVFEGTPACR